MKSGYGIRQSAWRPLGRRSLIEAIAAAALIAVFAHAGYASQEKGRVMGDDQAVAFAATLARQGRCGEAVGILEPICENRPDLQRAAEQLASCYIELGRAGRAADLLEKRLETDPGHYPFIRLLGNAYLDLGERDMAIGAWRSVLGDDPRLARYYGLVGRLMMEAGFYEEAIETYRRGRFFGNLYRSYTAEIIRLERLLGRTTEAFMEMLALIDSSPGLDPDDVRRLAGIYAESGAKERLFAAVDSAAVEGGGRLDIVRAVLLLESERYGEAGRYITGRSALHDREFYAFIRYLSAVAGEEKGAGFVTFYRKALDEFLSLYPASPVAPEVMLVLAGRLREEASYREERVELLERALRTIDLVREHEGGKPLLERAAILEAEIFLEDLHRPREAIAALEGVRFASRRQSIRAEEIRMTALVRAGDWEGVGRRAAFLAASGDSAKAAIGLYGKGLASFFRGEYGEAVDVMSGLAETHPGSRWANDALETAILVEEARAEGTGPLDCYREALALEAAGSPAAAADSLGAFIERYPASALIPRALYERAGLDIATGREGRAIDGLRSLAELHPLSELAPRALERLAGLERGRDRGRAMELYEAILERYPDDPFLERVRRAYMALRREAEEE